MNIFIITDNLQNDIKSIYVKSGIVDKIIRIPTFSSLWYINSETIVLLSVVRYRNKRPWNTFSEKKAYINIMFNLK